MSLRVTSWNAGGLARNVRNRAFLRSIEDFDIILVQETLVLESARRPAIPGFQLFARHAVKPIRGRPVGGLATFVSFSLLNSYDVTAVENVDECECECQLLRFSRVQSASPEFPELFFVCNVYVPAFPAPVDYGRLNSFLGDILETRAPLCPFLLAGDFNGHAQSRARAFRGFVSELCDEGFKNFPELGSRVPTFISHKGSSVIDFCFGRGWEWKGDGCAIFSLETFGHRLLQLEFLFPRLSKYALSPRTSFRRHVNNLPVNDGLLETLRGKGWDSPVGMLRSGVSAVFSFFLAWLLPHLFTVRPPAALEDDPWVRYLSFQELRDLRSAKAKVDMLSRNFRLGEDTGQLGRASREFLVLRSSLRHIALDRFAAGTQKAGDDPSSLWKTVRNFRIDPSAAQGLPVDTLCTYFHTLFNRASDVISLPFLYEWAPEEKELDARFTLVELDRVFSELCVNVAPGPSGVGNDVILALGKIPGTRKVLLDLFNGCLLGGSIPEALGKCEMFLLYKGKGDPLLPNSYRAIALLDCFLKLYERLLFHRLDRWAKKLDLVPPLQFGFRPRSGTLDAIFVFSKLLERFVFRGSGLLFAALIDFKSAFPSVDRSLLFKKLAGWGMSVRFGRALHALFKNNTFVLRFASGVTQEFQVNTGLREGSVLSPLLFSLFISDMEQSVLRPFDAGVNFQYQDFKVGQVPVPGLLYADDLIILARSAFCLRARLKRLEEYVTRNKLTVNVSKCEVVVFGDHRENFSFRFLSEALPVRSSCKYLGVSFGESSGIDLHLKSLSSRFSTSVTVFFQLMNKLQVGNLKLLSRLTTSLLLSSLYGIEFAIEPTLASDLSVHFRRGLRSFVGVPSRVSNDFLSMMFPSLSFDLFLAKRKLGFLRRMTGPSDTLASVFFLVDRIDDFPRGFGFSSDLLSFLATLGLPELAYCSDKSDISRALGEELEKSQLLAWERMRAAKSTSFLCSVFSCPQELYKSLLFASSLNKATLRIFLLMWSGSVAISIFGAHSRVCHLCQQPLTSQHFFGCDFDICGHLSLIVAVRNDNLVEVLRTTVQAYFNYYLRCKPAILSEDEGLLLDSLDSVDRFSSLFPSS